MSEKDVPMIPKHQAESMMMYMTWAMKNVVAIALAFAIAMTIAIFIFVNSYTVRTKEWLATIAQLQTGVVNEKEANTVQQQIVP